MLMCKLFFLVIKLLHFYVDMMINVNLSKLNILWPESAEKDLLFFFLYKI